MTPEEETEREEKNQYEDPPFIVAMVFLGLCVLAPFIAWVSNSGFVGETLLGVLQIFLFFVVIPLVIWAKRVKRITVCNPINDGWWFDGGGIYEFSDKQREKNEKRNEFEHWAFILAIIFAVSCLVLPFIDLYIIYYKNPSIARMNIGLDKKIPLIEPVITLVFIWILLPIFLTSILVWAGMVGRLPDKSIRDPYDYGHDRFNYLDEDGKLIKCSE